MPNTKSQAPNTKQIPINEILNLLLGRKENFEDSFRSFGYWDLELIWILEFVIWSLDDVLCA